MLTRKEATKLMKQNIPIYANIKPGTKYKDDHLAIQLDKPVKPRVRLTGIGTKYVRTLDDKSMLVDINAVIAFDLGIEK